MASDPGTEQVPAIPEDTVDLGERLDPVRTLLRRTASGDQRAAAALVDVLGPRIHGLAVHVTGSAARAGSLTVAVLRSCLRDAGALATSGLPGEAAVLDRARRAAVATEPTGAVRSLAAPDLVQDRTRDRREVEVMRVLLQLPPAERALVEAAAQGRFGFTALAREQAAVVLSRVLDQLVPFGGPEEIETRALASLDALALADADERARLRELTGAPETASIHRRAIEAAARLAVLTAVPPSRDLRIAVLEGFSPPEPAEPAEPQYRGDFATPVLGTSQQRRMVGPPARAGADRVGGEATGFGAAGPVPSVPSSPPAAADASRGEPSAAPAFAVDPAQEKRLGRRRRRRERRRGRREDRGVPWFSWGTAVVAVLAAAVLGVLLWDAQRELAASEQFAATWSERTVSDGAQPVTGAGSLGSWRAVLGPEGVVLRAEGVDGWEGEVLELWAVQGGEPRSLGVLTPAGDGTVEFTSSEPADSLLVTREMAPGNESGTPSTRVVTVLEP